MGNYSSSLILNTMDTQKQSKVRTTSAGTSPESPLAFLSSIRWREISFPKLALLLIIGVLVVAIIITLVRNVLLVDTGGLMNTPAIGGGASRGMSPPMMVSETADFAVDGYVANQAGKGMAIAPAPVPGPGYVPGDTAEAYEIKDYNYEYETRSLETTCGAILNLKPREEVIFEASNEGERNCYFRFKVANESLETVLVVLNDLDPKTVNENTRTIQRQLENNLNQLEILGSNLTSIEEILEEAVTSYDELTALARSSANAEALATSINEKIRLIDQLKQRREQTRQQIDNLNRATEEQLDRLAYTYITVSVTEQKFIDWRRIADSWQYQLQKFVLDFNGVLQMMTLSFVLFMMQVVGWSLFILFLIVIAKYGWLIVKRIWRA